MTEPLSAETRSYVCCFCDKPIAFDDPDAVALAAINLRSWTDAVIDPWGGQAFYTHSTCLQSRWTGRWPWEEHILFAGSD